jgi:ubiquinone biosynthesis protein COQ9
MIKDQILEIALKNAPAEGWSMAALRKAARTCGQEAQMADALFGTAAGARAAVSDLFDRRMMENLRSIDREKLKMRERIALAVRTRLDLMAPYCDGLRTVCPTLSRAAIPLWRSADRIWRWAGDTATDYNHYTKRALLSGVMASTLLFWMQDNSRGHAATHAFLNRRIETVLTFGRLLSTLKKKAA